MAEKKENQQSIILLAGSVTVLMAVLLYVVGPSLIPASLSVRGTKVYFADRISTAHTRIINRFNEIHRGRIEVVPVDLPFDKFSTNERKELLARSLRSRSGKLDLFCVDQIWVERFARWCEPLDGYFSPAQRAELLPVALESCYFDSTLVALPLIIDVGLMYYRSDLIRRLPDADSVEARLRRSMAWPEFLDLQRRMGYAGRPFYIFQADAYEGLVCNYLEVLAGHDRSSVSTHGINLNTPAARSALQMLVDLIHTQKAAPPDVTDFDEPRSYSYMLDQNAVFVRGWPNFVENFRATYPDTARLLTLRQAALPHFPGSSPTSVFGGWNVMVSKFSTRKTEALEFLHFLETPEAQRILYENEGFLPVVSSLYTDSAYVKAHPDLAYFRELLNRGFHRPAVVDYTRISDVLSHYVRLALLRRMPVGEALGEASRLINSNTVLLK